MMGAYGTAGTPLALKMDRKIAAAFVLVVMCIALVTCSFLLTAWVEALDGERAALERECSVVAEGIAKLINRKRALIAEFEELGGYYGARLDHLGFYSELQQIAADRAVDVISTRWEEPSPVRDGVSSIAMVLRGDYHDIMRVMAACRGLPGPVRAVGFAMRPSPVGGVEADIKLEAILAFRERRSSSE